MRIHLVAAARPNFMKIAPLYHALSNESWAEAIIVHTGQHYDLNMSDAFFRDLKLPAPDRHLGIGSGSHAAQTGNTMIGYEKLIMDEMPDLTVVVGDVNSTIAATLAATKLGVRVAHLEAGLRSYDRTMPEEINRVATDALADLLWTPSPDADENLLREGVSSSKIERVGNIMIDSLELLRPKIEELEEYRDYGLDKASYGMVTLHRPANVDTKEALKRMCDVLIDISKSIKLVFPVHPRTQKQLTAFGYLNILKSEKDIILTEPLSYIRFMNLIFNSRLVVTDSGGIQEETSYLGIPCFTLRPNTERPITVTEGTNRLCSADDVVNMVKEAMSKGKTQPNKIELWDGNTASRVVRSIQKLE